MFRALASRLATSSSQVLRQTAVSKVKPLTLAPIRSFSHAVEESDEEFVKRYVAFFNQPDIDGWDIRRGLMNLAHDDCVPDPEIIIAALKAIRRVNDYALAIRFLETTEFKTGGSHDKIWPYIVQEITPTLKELGIETPSQLGYDKPELALESVYDM
uniref:Cytochrome c oxidase subunit 5A, mitochondrial n=1 Tax=Diaphorina citri TaxID=121845 RepID=Q0PXX1_DIACI|nr:putative mitochondrial cytochrome c oxidase polypeptide Va [Diaphorina citri]